MHKIIATTQMTIPEFAQFGSLAKKAFEDGQKRRRFQWISLQVKNFQFGALIANLKFKKWKAIKEDRW